jgi:hypothetical protein
MTGRQWDDLNILIAGVTQSSAHSYQICALMIERQRRCALIGFMFHAWWIIHD